MGFSAGSYAKIWQVEDKGKYSIAQVSISRKDKNTNTYNVEFQDGYVRLVGNAHDVLKGVEIEPNKGVFVKISNCDVTNLYTAPDGKVTRTPHYTIFGLELYDNNKNNNKGYSSNSAQKRGSNDFVNIPDGTDEEELPFS